MDQRRREKLEAHLSSELSLMFVRELELPPNSLASISRVVLSEDTRWAQVWVSILPLSYRSKVRNIIKKKQGLITSLLNKRLRIKPVPKLKFMTDFAEEHASELEAVIDKAMKEL